MKKGKYGRKPRRSNVKHFAVLVSVILILAAAVGSSIAFLADSTGSIANKFMPQEVTSMVIEDPFYGVTKTNVKVKNTGDVSAFIRADIVVTWMKVDGDNISVLPEAPVLGTDYTMELNSDDWFEKNGFYYYNQEVAAEGQTSNLINEAVALTTNGEYFVSIEILCSAIQAEGEITDNEILKHPVEVAWGVKYHAGEPATITAE